MDIKEALRTLDYFDTKMDLVNLAIKHAITNADKKRLLQSKEELRKRVLDSITQFIKEK